MKKPLLQMIFDGTVASGMTESRAASLRSTLRLNGFRKVEQVAERGLAWTTWAKRRVFIRVQTSYMQKPRLYDAFLVEGN